MKITSVVLVVAMLVAIMNIGPVAPNYQSAFAHYGVDIDQCKNDEYYYEDNEIDWDKNLRVRYGEGYDGRYGSKNTGDDSGNSASQGIGQSQSSIQSSQVVSGDDTEGSGNNFSLQNQENSK